MTLVGLEKQPPGWKPSGDWIVVSVINLATFWDIWSLQGSQVRLFDYVSISWKFYKPVTHPPPPHPPPLYGGICDIDCARFIDYLKWRAIQPAIQ